MYGCDHHFYCVLHFCFFVVLQGVWRPFVILYLNNQESIGIPSNLITTKIEKDMTFFAGIITMMQKCMFLVASMCHFHLFYFQRFEHNQQRYYPDGRDAPILDHADRKEREKELGWDKPRQYIISSTIVFNQHVFSIFYTLTVVPHMAQWLRT